MEMGEHTETTVKKRKENSGISTHTTNTESAHTSSQEIVGISQKAKIREVET